MNAPVCLLDVQNTLGEGPLWVASTQQLYWFDIKQARVLSFRPGSGETRDWVLPMRASAAAPRRDGRLLLSTELGLARFDPVSGEIHLDEPVDLGPGFRSNDGKIDGRGRFWWTSMDDDGGRRPGAIWRRDADGVSRRMIEGVSIANTVSCSPDGRTLYWADSGRQTLYAQALTGDGLGERRIFADLTGESGTPDGSAVDAEGCLWNCQWGAWRIVRYRPDGTVDRIVELPVEQPTSCAFGGANLTTLYITSAREGLDEAALSGQPLAGGLFALETDVPGLALPLLPD
ncbi:MAG TPA: SMP-30/gluconolactonase/LRE family protein [Caulobacter sp.]|nr:SMP-30/gluconolactonase/LRE family protein [Caulobacter sp.]